MSPAVEEAQAQWFEQLHAMRKAIAELGLPADVEEAPAYGHDIDFDDYDDISGTASGEDIWDIISDEYEEGYSSDHLDEFARAPAASNTYDEQWLVAKCSQVARSSSGLDAEALKEQIAAVLSSDSNADEELQMMLADIVGYGELDLVADLISHRQSLLRSLREPAASQGNGVMGRLQTRAEREEALRRADWEHKNAALAPAMDRTGPQYPHVYKAHDAGNKLSAYGKKYALPPDSVHRDNNLYEEYEIPAVPVGTIGAGRKLIEIRELDGLCQRTFKGYKTLNRMQSLVYPVAYKTSENMLICAPTGAGKTDAAMLTILNTVAKNVVPNPIDEPEATDFTVMAEDFKIIYVAPMKALAAEVTEKLGKRLAWLGIKARELTGDMHLTKAEILDTQIIVTTPEKWDVVTRKSTGDTELVQKVRLLIIDEVHMLHDERGAVLESLVARTQRQVESTQSLIRIVGLSATLPNYVDVAEFLHVNKMAGLFYFDASFRPVPLEQHFIGAKGKPGTAKSRENLEKVAFDKVVEMLKLGHQIMVFVHSRKDTVKTARRLYDMAMEEQCTDLFDPQDHPRYENAVRDMKQSKGRELRELLGKGMGTHHAGMPRSDRNLIERLFAEGVLKILCCTATLAWGVNLPAAAVLIKGTQVYNAQEGKFTDLGILDVLQIFGRAGRPQFQDSGIGFICTTHDRLDHYMRAVTEQQPIESRFSSRLIDNLNAEISLGTVTTVSEAVTWLGYSYLFVRMKRSPLMYGIEWSEIRDDPQLVGRRRKLIIDAARTLQRSQMIVFNETTEDLRAKDVGRIASQYYVQQSSIEIFNAMMRPRSTDADALAMIAPLNRDVLRIRLFLTPDFVWNDRHHGTSESFWIWVENSETSEIFHHEFFILSRKKLYDDHELDFTIPLSDPLPTQVYVRAVSDRWLGAETVHPISFQHLIRPDTESVYTDLLNLQPLPIAALKNPLLEEVYAQRFQYFNPMQSQIFHCLYHTSANVLLGSPTGSGKTVAAELAMWWAFREKPGSKVVYIAPMKALVRERVQDWRKRLAGPMGLKLVELTGDNTPDTRTIRDADIIITTPEKWDGISRSWQTRGYVRQVSLVIIDEIHLLGGDRGPILEIIVSRMNYIASQKKDGSIRLLGMSTACANAADLGNWLGVKEGLFNFRHSVRPVPLEIFIDGFPEQRGFCPLMQSMNRPTFLAIKAHSPEKPVIVFVASRRQTRLTARDLINFCGMEDNPRRFLRMSEEDLALNLDRVHDDSLREALSFGIGLHHAGLVESDRSLSEELFANNKIQILVATSTLAWGVNLPAHLVVVKGTQFFDAKTEGYKDMDLTDVLQMLGRAGRPQFDDSGIARIFTQDAKKEFYKHFLHTGFPVESSLHKVLDNHLGAEISAGTITTKQDALDYLTWTFFFRRLHKNPSFYGLEISAEEHNTIAAQSMANDYMVELVETSLRELDESSCAVVESTGEVDPTPLGKIMSYYYLSHKTIRYLVQNVKRDATFAEALAWISHATEYDELPVRHNEDLINMELSKALPISADDFGLPMWDPHVKAFLLLQAHFSRIDLPISDYVGDQNSVLDQSIRIVQATIDVLTELGYRSSCETVISILQAIKSARWPNDGPLSIFPGVDVEKEKARLEHPKAKPKTLIEVTSTAAVDLERAGKFAGVSHGGLKRFTEPVSRLPVLKLDLGNVNAITLEFKATRQNSARMQQGGVRIYAPRYPKPQTEGFFAIISYSSTDEIVALKRVNWPDPGKNGGNNRGEAGKQPMGGAARSLLQVSIKVSLPPDAQGKRLDISVHSDSYPGMRWGIEGVEIPEAPLVDAYGKGKEKA
ncbi:activating signal cointegrator 1 complex subunit 3 [Bipolaris maydis]|nr:activating signal cointegrator 1 complex subunit 3 [Bipolaris maydis]KAJ6194627.1 activating signal cointegrator 1 complex subunit 3 [Bipolaris maydis]